MALKQIKTHRRRLADEVYDQLVEAIMSREISTEDRLIQEKLAAELNISRTPVREALMRLETEGVLEVAANGGFRLACMDPKEVRQLYQARAAIEGQAARILAVHANREVLDRLRDLTRREENLTNPSTRDYFIANRRIHRAFMVEAENKFLLEMFDMIWGKAMAFHLFSAIENVDISQSLGDHMTLIDAIATGDVTNALETFTAHIQAGFDLQIAGLEEVKGG